MEHSFAPLIPGFNPLVGTASWSDKTLLDCGKFYPPTAKTQTPEARLRFYASQFNLVEVDTSYYAIPAVTKAQRWAERKPPGFVFNVKAFSLFTGQWTSTDVLPKDIKEALGSGRRMVYKDSAQEQDANEGHERVVPRTKSTRICFISGHTIVRDMTTIHHVCPSLEQAR